MKRIMRNVVEAYRPFRWIVLGMFGFIFLAQGLSLLVPYLQGRVIDGLVGGKPIGRIYLLVFATLAVWMVRTVFLSYWRELYEIKNLDYSIPQHVNRITLERLLGFSIGQHVSENSGIKQSVISRGQNALTTMVELVLYQVAPMIFEVVLLIGALLWYSRVLGFTVLAGIAGATGIVMWTNFRFRTSIRQVDKMYNENSKFQGEVLRNVELVLANAQEARAVRECDESLGDISDFARDLWTRFQFFSALRNVVIGLTRFSIMVIGVLLVYRREYTVGQLVMFLSWSNEALGQVFTVGSLHRQLIRHYTSVRRYFDILNVEPDVKVMPNPVRPERFQGRIEFRNVTLRYRRRTVLEEGGETHSVARPDPKIGPALENVSFAIEPGERIAIVGESGAGKSTILYAVIRAQDPDEGQIVVDGNDLRVLDLKRFREAVGIVDQEVALFDHTLRYNITYGLNGRGAAVTDADLDRIAEMSCINRFFPRLEHGYDTIIGERGVKLSGGERQRVGIARALIKEPDILIFDEATSNLDSENEALIKESIEKASHGRTTIIIAHRFSTIRRVDRVLVFERGRLVGEGTHNELARNCEPYQRLIRNQMV